jgi:hypothetical protein
MGILDIYNSYIWGISNKASIIEVKTPKIKTYAVLSYPIILDIKPIIIVIQDVKKKWPIPKFFQI